LSASAHGISGLPIAVVGFPLAFFPDESRRVIVKDRGQIGGGHFDGRSVDGVAKILIAEPLEELGQCIDLIVMASRECDQFVDKWFDPSGCQSAA
jgi:hypothetical protein